MGEDGPMSQVALLANPAARSGRAAGDVQTVLDRLRTHGVEPLILDATSAREAASAAADASADARGGLAERPSAIPRPGWRQVLGRVWRALNTDHVGLIAAGVAFYGLLALFPAITASMAPVSSWCPRATVQNTCLPSTKLETKRTAPP